MLEWDKGEWTLRALVSQRCIVSTVILEAGDIRGRSTSMQSWSTEALNHMIIALISEQSKSDDPSISGFLAAWHVLFSEFTQGDFTYPEDRYSALLGMLNVLRGQAGLENVSGIWKDAFVIDAKHPRKGRLHNKQPIWSWTPVDGEIDWYPSPSPGRKESRTMHSESQSDNLGASAIARVDCPAVFTTVILGFN